MFANLEKFKSPNLPNIKPKNSMLLLNNPKFYIPPKRPKSLENSPNLPGKGGGPLIFQAKFKLVPGTRMGVGGTLRIFGQKSSQYPMGQYPADVPPPV